MAHPLSTGECGNDEESWPIGDVARRTGLSIDTLRYYEKAGLLPAVPRDPGSRRRYRQKDLDALAVIKAMREAGFGIDEVRELLAIKTDDPPEVLVARARNQVATRRARVRDRQRALGRALALLDRWEAELDDSGIG